MEAGGCTTFETQGSETELANCRSANKLSAGASPHNDGGNWVIGWLACFWFHSDGPRTLFKPLTLSNHVDHLFY